MTRKTLILHIALRLAAAILILLPGLAMHAQAYTSIVIFGDSLTDTGNDTAVSKGIYGASAAVPSPATGYTNGRFTDGTDTSPAAHNYNGVWAEQLAAMLPAKPAILNSLAGGNNYAYGFATTNTGTSVFTYGPGNALSFNVNNMGLQVSTYLATKPVITNKTLFIVWGGANDLIAAQTSQDIVNAAARDAGIVQQLIAAGATDFIVPNLPPLGLVPRYNGSPTTSIPTTAACQGFDQALAQYLAGVLAAAPSVRLYQLDTFTLFNTIVGPPITTGFANVTASSQGVTTVNPDTYLFWDDLHPTTFGHSLLAAAALRLLGTPVVTTTTAASSNLNANIGATVTLTASVTDASGMPTGTVTFLDGTTPLGSGYVLGNGNTGTATFTTSTLAAGTHSITAQFAGVNGFASSVSGAISEVVSNPGVNMAFLSPLTLTAGASGTASLTVSPVGGFSGTGTFACGTFGSAGFTCSLTPSSLVFKGDNAQQTVAVTVSAPTMAALQRPGAKALRTAVWAFALPWFGVIGFAAMRRRRAGLRRAGVLAVLVVATAVAFAGITGCSNSSSANKLLPGNYFVPVTMTVNGVATTQSLQVVIQ